MHITNQINQGSAVSTQVGSAKLKFPALPASPSAPQVYPRIDEVALLAQDNSARATQRASSPISTRSDMATRSDYVPAIQPTYQQFETADDFSATVGALQAIYTAATLLLHTDVIAADGRARIYLNRCVFIANEARAANRPGLVAKIVAWTLDGLNQANFDSGAAESIATRYLPQFMAGEIITLERTLKLANY